MVGVLKPFRPKDGEMWICQIDDDVQCTKVTVIAARQKTVELQEIVQGTIKGPVRILRYNDVVFVEKL